MPSDSRFRRINFAAGACFSMKIASTAPRLIASMPTAPVPAKTSRKREPARDGAKILNSVSRKRSDVGRSASPLSDLSKRERYFPAIIRMCSSDFREVVAALPLAGELAEDALKGGRLLRVFGKGEGFCSCQFQEFFVAEGVGDVEAEVAGWAGTEEFAGAAEEEIGFGDFEAVGGADHGFEAGAGLFRHASGADEDAMGFGGAAADASPTPPPWSSSTPSASASPSSTSSGDASAAELVELGEAEA